MTEFEHGVLYAAAVVIAVHDQPVIAATIVREAGLSDADCSDMDDFEKHHLRVIQGENGIALRGL